MRPSGRFRMIQLRPAASEADSRDTVERMADQLQELEDRNQQPDAREPHPATADPADGNPHEVS